MSLSKKGYCAEGADTENEASALSEHGVHHSAVALYICVRHECLDRSRKAAAVDAECAVLTCKELLGKAESEGESLLGDVLGGIYVLQIPEARKPRCYYVFKKRPAVALGKRLRLSGYSAVFRISLRPPRSI